MFPFHMFFNGRRTENIDYRRSLAAVIAGTIVGLLIALSVSSFGCSPSNATPPGPSSPQHHFATTHSMLPGFREFDLLSAPIPPGGKVATIANVSWKNYRDCRMFLADAVQPFFLDSYLRDDTQGTVTGNGTNTGKLEARFAAIVTCNTDEPGVQTGRVDQEWPPLITDAGVENVQPTQPIATGDAAP